MSDSVRPNGRQPTRLPRPWDSLGKNTGVGCHFLLQCMKVKSESEVVSDPQRPHGLQPSRLLHPWNFPGKSTEAACHCLLGCSTSAKMHRPNRAPEVSARLPVPSLWAALARLASLVFPPPCMARVKGRKIVPSPRKPTCEPHFASLASSPCSRWRPTRVFAGLRGRRYRRRGAETAKEVDF